MARIIYVTVENQNIPSGGSRNIYRHVELLAKLGFDAYVTWRQGQPKPEWFEHDAPILDVTTPRDLEPTDHLVMSEVDANNLERTRDTRAARYVFVQNHHYIFQGLRQYRDFQAAGIPHLLALSGVIARFLEGCFNIDTVPVLPPGIDTGLFQPQKKKAQIAYMPRKRAADRQFIEAIFKRFMPQYRDIPWVPIDDMSEAEVAYILSQSAVFLSLNIVEGLGMPPIEAMAAGCLVVGFTGGGGKDYATTDNGLWVDGEDHVGCAQALGRALDRFHAGESEVRTMLEAGHATAQRYNIAAATEALRNFWTQAVDERDRICASL